MDLSRATQWIAASALAACSSASAPPSATDAGSDSGAPSNPLASAKSWAYVIQKQTAGGKIQRLAQSSYDVVVIDDPRTFSDSPGYDARGDVVALHATSGAAGRPKVVLAYVDIGEAESYRTYWQPAYKVGSPDWIVAGDPDGWSGNYPVAYWRDDWKKIVASMVDAVVADGYDGIYMDWVEAATFEAVVTKASADHVDAQAEMVSLVKSIRDRAHATQPAFLVVAQNAIDLRSHPDYLALLDGEAQEQVMFDGAADVSGADPRQGDCRLPQHAGDPPPADNPQFCSGIRTMTMSTDEYVSGLRAYQSAGIPVFVVDYALVPDHAALAYAQDKSLGFVGLVTMRSLEDLTATPPPPP